MRPSVHRRLAPLLRKQFGAFTTRQAEAAGVSRSAIVRMEQRSEVVRLYRGVYLACSYPDTWQARWMAAALVAGPRAVVSHMAAAYLHGLQHTTGRRRPDVELTTPRHHYLRRAGIRAHTAEHLTAEDVTRLGAWPIATVAWTLCSIASLLGVNRFERALDAAVASGQVTSGRVAATAQRFRWCSGVSVVRTVLERHLPGIRLTRSEAERTFLRLLRHAGLPLPEVNVRVIDAGGSVRYLDFAYRQWRIAIEIDVHDSHLRPVGRNRDGHRQNDLVTAWTPLRFDELDLLYGADQVVAEVRRALVAAGAPIRTSA